MDYPDIGRIDDGVWSHGEAKVEWLKAELKCAAGPWIDGPPPKDGKRYLVVFTKQPHVARWSPRDPKLFSLYNQDGWDGGKACKITLDPIMHAKINMPDKSEKAGE